ncbi:MAG: ABC transporter ATP-binding protein [Desulfocurvibacter africanus]
MIKLEDLEIQVPGFAVRVGSLHLERGAFFCLLGPTGSGKSLILETIAGMIRPVGGRVLLEGADATHEVPERRRLGIVYQDSALFPHLSVEQNIRYGLRFHPEARREAEKRVSFLAEALEITHLLSRRTASLSGGERQRTALARALAVRPRVLLLDEPLSALDPVFRDGMRRLLKDVHRDLGLTVLMVTHDFSEALFLADRVAVLRNGALEQQGPTEEIFRRPATEFVARFTGMRNVFPVMYRGGSAFFCGLEVEIPAGERPGYVGLRPEDLLVHREACFPDGCRMIEGELLGISPSGFHYEALIRANGYELAGILDRRTLLESRLAPGDRVLAGFDPALLHVFGRPVP